MNDLEVAKRYVSKAENARRASTEFTLSFNEFKKLMNKKKCEYSGLEMSDVDGFYYRTIDRIDNSLGYVSGNVRAVAHGINQFKSNMENQNNPIDFKMLNKLVKKFNEEGL